MKLSGYLEALKDNLISTGSFLDTEIQEIKSDSRKVTQGDIFVAIRGARLDGESFIPQALSAGCTVIVTSGAFESETVTVIRVNDSYLALAQLAEYHYGYPAKKIQMIGVTGTNGKSSCVAILSSLLGDHCGMIGTLGVVFKDLQVDVGMTTPDALQLQKYLRVMCDQGATSVVMEVSSHALEQSRTGSISFGTAIFTNLSQDHLDYHETMEEYFCAKTRLFESLSPESFAVINVDDGYGERLKNLSQGTVVSVGNGLEADALIQSIIPFEDSTKFKI